VVGHRAIAPGFKPWLPMWGVSTFTSPHYLWRSLDPFKKGVIHKFDALYPMRTKDDYYYNDFDP